MFKDDQMLPMLTGVVIMLAIGLLAQRSETVMGWLGEGTDASEAAQIVLNTDSMVVSRGGFTRLDVLANDESLPPQSAEELLIFRSPECGDAFVQDGAVQYRPSSSCGDLDTFSYRLAGTKGTETGVVHVNIVSPEEIMAAKTRADQGERQGSQAITAEAEPAPKPEIIAEAEPVETAVEPRAPEAQPIADQAAGSDDIEPAMPEEADGPVGAEELTLALAVPDAPLPAPDNAARAPVIEPQSDTTVAETPQAVEEAQTLAAEPAAEAPSPDQAATPEVDAAIELSLPRLTDFNPGVTQPQTRELLEEPVVTLATITADPSLQRDHLAMLGRGGSAFDAAPSGTLHRLITPSRATELAPLAGPAVDNGTPPENPRSLTTLPALEVPTGGLAPMAAPDKPVTPPPVIAALPDPTVTCTTPPSMTFDIQAAAQTEISLIAPCHPGGVAELSYSNLRFAIPLDGEGRGAVMALGFEPTTPAVIRLEDGAEMTFDLPFKGTDRVMRVALAWDLPVQISLHALEFGAGLQSDGDIWNRNPKSYGEIRPTGGGYLTTYQPEQGAGQPIEIYSHLVRRNGRKGVVELKVEYTSRDRERLAGTCGTGDFARPHFRILRSEAGRLGRPFAGRLPSVACDESGAGGNTLAANSVGTLVVTP